MVYVLFFAVRLLVQAVNISQKQLDSGHFEAVLVFAMSICVYMGA